MRKNQWRLIGPGLIMAAAGVGAADIVAASAAGGRFGFSLLWAVAFAALLKYILNEGLARWQIATGTTMVEGWNDRIGQWLIKLFLAYLILWSIFVGGGLLSAVAIVVKAVFHQLSVFQAGLICAVSVLLIVFTGSYRFFKGAMKACVLLIFVGFVYGAWKTMPAPGILLSGLFCPTIPRDSFFAVLGLMGAIGSSLTLLCYGYWARQEGLDKPENLGATRLDLAICYVITGLFDICVMVMAAGGGRLIPQDAKGILMLGENLSKAIGPWGYWVFIVGFWAAVYSTLISFFSAIPALFCDLVATVKNLKGKEKDDFRSMRNPWFWSYAVYSAIVSIIMLQIKRPVLFILIFSALGGIFMIFLSAVLLYLNNRPEMGKLKNGLMTNFLLLVNLALFTILAGRKLGFF